MINSKTIRHLMLDFRKSWRNLDRLLASVGCPIWVKEVCATVGETTVDFNLVQSMLHRLLKWCTSHALAGWIRAKLAHLSREDVHCEVGTWSPLHGCAGQCDQMTKVLAMLIAPHVFYIFQYTTVINNFTTSPAVLPHFRGLLSSPNTANSKMSQLRGVWV